MKKMRFYLFVLFLIIIFIISKLILNHYDYEYLSYVYVCFYYFISDLILIGTSIILYKTIKEKDKWFIIISFILLYIGVSFLVHLGCRFIDFPSTEIISEDKTYVIRKEAFLTNITVEYYEYVNPFIRKNTVVNEYH